MAAKWVSGVKPGGEATGDRIAALMAEGPRLPDECGGVRGKRCVVFCDGLMESRETKVIAEASLRIYLNGTELVNLMCTPYHLDELVVGFLWSEGFIRSLEDVSRLDIGDGRADVWTRRRLSLSRRWKTSGFGGGVTFAEPGSGLRPLLSDVTVSPEEVLEAVRKLDMFGAFYREAGGIHISALIDGGEVVRVAEDIGRHNTIDRLAGAALLHGIDTTDLTIVTSGRISSEMMSKAVRMGLPVVISHTSPTTRAVEIAARANVALIGYARGNTFKVYAGLERVRGAQ